ncbi:MAG TPA: hypothetical protein VIY53_13795 [Acidobacteriaceae bacterium]
MATPGTQYPNQAAGQVVQPTAMCAYRSDSHFIMGLGIVLLCFGQAITGSHIVSIIGLAMIVLSSWID